MTFRLIPPIVDFHTGRLIAPSQLPGFRQRNSSRYRLSMGLGAFDASAVSAKEAELNQVRSERLAVEAELEQLRSGRAPALQVQQAPQQQPAGPPPSAPLAAAPRPPVKPKIPTWALVGVGVAGLLALRGLVK